MKWGPESDGIILRELIRAGKVNSAMVNSVSDRVAEIVGSTPRMVYERFKKHSRDARTSDTTETTTASAVTTPKRTPKKRKAAETDATPSKRQAMSRADRASPVATNVQKANNGVNATSKVTKEADSLDDSSEISIIKEDPGSDADIIELDSIKKEPMPTCRTTRARSVKEETKVPVTKKKVNWLDDGDFDLASALGETDKYSPLDF